MSDPDLIGFFKAAYPNGSWPRPFHILEGLQRIAAGETAKEAAKSVGTAPHFLENARKGQQTKMELVYST
jgi:hypothetical protein